MGACAPTAPAEPGGGPGEHGRGGVAVVCRGRSQASGASLARIHPVADSCGAQALLPAAAQPQKQQH